MPIASICYGSLGLKYSHSYQASESGRWSSNYSYLGLNSLSVGSSVEGLKPQVLSMERKPSDWFQYDISVNRQHLYTDILPHYVTD